MPDIHALLTVDVLKVSSNQHTVALCLFVLLLLAALLLVHMLCAASGEKTENVE